MRDKPFRLSYKSVMVDERRWREGGWRGIEINVRGQSSRRCIMHRQTQVDGQEDRRMGNISKIFSAKRSFAITLVAFFHSVCLISVFFDFCPI